jgi:acetylserotonin N-methyltransferase
MSSKDLPNADPSIVLDLLEAFRRSKVMFAAAALGVFDRLSAGPASASELAKDLNVSRDGLERLIDACVSLQLLARNGLNYENTPTANAFLCRSSPDQLTGYVSFSNNFLWKLWDHLEDAIREGTNRWPQTFGWEGPIFDHIFRTEEVKREFTHGMHGFGRISSPEVVRAFDLSRFQRLADLGGATGHLAIAACQQYPNLNAVVFDLPGVIPLAKEKINEASLGNRIEVSGGDFFTDPLPQADLYAVGRILHDWTEDKIHKLLERVFECLPKDGALLIAEKLLDEDKKGPIWAQMQSLNMLLVTEGKERTFKEYESLLKAAGYKEIMGQRTNGPVDAVLAIKKKGPGVSSVHSKVLAEGPNL